MVEEESVPATLLELELGLQPKSREGRQARLGGGTRHPRHPRHVPRHAAGRAPGRASARRGRWHRGGARARARRARRARLQRARRRRAPRRAGTGRRGVRRPAQIGDARRHGPEDPGDPETGGGAPQEDLRARQAAAARAGRRHRGADWQDGPARAQGLHGRARFPGPARQHRCVPPPAPGRAPLRARPALACRVRADARACGCR